MSQSPDETATPHSDIPPVHANIPHSDTKSARIDTCHTEAKADRVDAPPQSIPDEYTDASQPKHTVAGVVENFRTVLRWLASARSFGFTQNAP